MTTFIDIRERVEQVLADTGNDIWDRMWIEEAARRSLADYSLINPVEAITSVSPSSDTRELDISSVTGLLEVQRVWYPYTSSDPEHPPTWRNFEYWRYSQTLYFPDGVEIDSSETARIFYTKMQTLNGLDGETTTTLPSEDITLIVDGAAGHAATSRAVDLTEKVSVGQATAQQVRAWGLSKLQEFRAGLNAVGRRKALKASGQTEGALLDRWDREWA